ncbi:4'-phosphopantetheinyl transferase family protein [Adhaeribacter radiodurans]|uniref:Enterobactin synthase component D n=1 Tax=Adhaeribacter radiodurans TaxID=2745197 RepID=A0A7L7L7X0_9BACT|nr:4'-phosphopantetheinyl transferase superfamily protein [Adhaeribacter radiodurans]QMU28897.1 4'-phosphopantetheinyl transferase superfamily protein [Adhaeribacter radiodurans]
MPIAQIKEIAPGTLIGRWTLTETVAQLKAYLNLPAELQIPEFITHDKRQTEWLASRILAYQMLQYFTSVPYPLHNNEIGKPYFAESSYHISISHTQQQVAVLLSNNVPVGIDIERVQSKVSRVQNKFLNAEEKLAINNDLVKLTIAWSAKESLYKLYGKKNLIFNQNLLLSPFPISLTGNMEAFIRTPEFQKKYIVYFEVEKDTVLTYCLGS